MNYITKEEFREEQKQIERSLENLEKQSLKHSERLDNLEKNTQELEKRLTEASVNFLNTILPSLEIPKDLHRRILNNMQKANKK